MEEIQIDKNNWQILVNKENIKEIQDYLIPKKTYPTNGLIIGNYYGLDKGTLIYTFEEVPYIKTIDIYQFRKYILPTKELNTVKENNLRFKIGDKVNINGIPFGIRFIKEILDNDFYKLNDDSVFYIDSLKLIPIVEKEEINNTQYIIKNAIIKSTSLTGSDFYGISAKIFLDYGNSKQIFSYPSMGKVPKTLHIDFTSYFITKCMRIANCESWENIIGKYIRVKINSTTLEIVEIGHILYEDWFNPKNEK